MQVRSKFSDKQGVVSCTQLCCAYKSRLIFSNAFIRWIFLLRDIAFFLSHVTPPGTAWPLQITIDHMNGKRIDFKNTHWKIVRLLHSIMWHICMDVGCNQKPATVATRSPAGNPCHFYATFSTFCAQLCTYIHLYICTFVVCLSTVIVYLFITRNNWISGQPAYPSSQCPNERSKKTGRPMHSES